MNKKFKTLMTVTLACLMLCGTAFAAPRGRHGRGRPPRHAPRHHAVGHHHHAPKCHGHHHRDAGWITLGAAAVGGLVGGIIGACR